MLKNSTSAPLLPNGLLCDSSGDSEETSPLNHLNGERILIGLSGGINSMAVLCRLIELGIKPKEVHLFYAHFAEHSPDTFQFVADGIRYARKHFDCVKVKITSNHVLRYFEEQNMIPHPASSPCSKNLKIKPINEYAFENDLKIDLVGYVKHELKRRAGKQQKTMDRGFFSLDKQYPIGEFSDEWCFEIVKRHIGWYPAIYTLLWNDEGFINFIESIFDTLPANVQNDYLRDKGKAKRVFKHNNCLPCKNMYTIEIIAIKYFYNIFYKKAMLTSNKIKRYIGRSSDEFYSTFGRDLGQESTCQNCVW